MSKCPACGGELTTGGCLVCTNRTAQIVSGKSSSEQCRSCQGKGIVIETGQAQRCPVCEGRGLVASGFYDFPRKVTY